MSNITVIPAEAGSKHVRVCTSKESSYKSESVILGWELKAMSNGEPRYIPITHNQVNTEPTCEVTMLDASGFSTVDWLSSDDFNFAGVKLVNVVCNTSYYFIPSVGYVTTSGACDRFSSIEEIYNDQRDEREWAIRSIKDEIAIADEPAGEDSK